MHEFVRTLLNESNKYSYGKRSFERGLWLVMLVLAFLPFMYRGFSHSGSKSQQDWGHFGDALSIMVTPLVLMTNVGLIFVPIYDVSRRKKLAKLLNYITTVSTIRAEQKNFLPVIDMFKAQNVYGWMYTRLVIQSYGKRMLDRIDSFRRYFFIY